MTGDQLAAFYPKQLIDSAALGVYGFTPIYNVLGGVLRAIYPGGALLQGTTLSRPTAGHFSITPDPTAAVDPAYGQVLTLAGAARTTAVPFENSAGIAYYFGLRYQLVPSAVETNVRTGEPEYNLYRSEVGLVATPTSVVVAGAGLTVNVDALCNPGAIHSLAGRTLTLYLLDPASPLSAVAFETLTVAWGGSHNTVTSAGQLGQAVPSVTAADYQVFMAGVGVSRGTPFDATTTVLLGSLTDAAFSAAGQTAVFLNLSQLGNIAWLDGHGSLKVRVHADASDSGNPQVEVWDVTGARRLMVDETGSITCTDAAANVYFRAAQAQTRVGPVSVSDTTAHLLVQSVTSARALALYVPTGGGGNEALAVLDSAAVELFVVNLDGTFYAGKTGGGGAYFSGGKDGLAYVRGALPYFAADQHGTTVLGNSTYASGSYSAGIARLSILPYQNPGPGGQILYAEASPTQVVNWVTLAEHSGTVRWALDSTGRFYNNGTRAGDAAAEAYFTSRDGNGAGLAVGFELADTAAAFYVAQNGGVKLLEVTPAGTLRLRPVTSQTANHLEIITLDGPTVAVNIHGQLTSDLSTGTAPLVVASATLVANLNAALLDGKDWAAPAAIGTGTPAAGSFSALTLGVTGLAEPGYSLSKSTGVNNVTLTTHGTYVSIRTLLDAAVLDRNTSHPVTGRLEVSNAGNYRVRYQLYLSLNGADQVTVQVYKNGSASSIATGTFTPTASGVPFLLTGEAFLALSANDVLELFAVAAANDGQVLSTLTPTAGVSVFSVERLPFN